MKTSIKGLLIAWYLFSILFCSAPHGVQGQNFGVFSVNVPAGWVFKQETSLYYCFEHNASAISINLYKDPETCPDLTAQNKIIMARIQESARNQEVVELHKPSFPPCQIMEQKSCHVMVIKAKEEEKRRALFHVKVGNMLYQFEATG